MTGADHERLRELTAAHVLGALGAEERAEVEAHLAVCEVCRQDVVDFSPLPALLARVDPDDLDPPEAAGAEPVVAAVRAEVLRLQQRERRWRAAAAVAVSVAAIVGFWAAGREEPAPGRAGGIELAVSAGAGAHAEVVADEHPWGTYVHLAASGLPERSRYSIWTVDPAGRWEAVGSWTATPDGRVELGCSTARSLDELDRVVVTSDDRSDVLLEARA